MRVEGIGRRGLQQVSALLWKISWRFIRWAFLRRQVACRKIHRVWCLFLLIKWGWGIVSGIGTGIALMPSFAEVGREVARSLSVCGRGQRFAIVFVD